MPIGVGPKDGYISTEIISSIEKDTVEEFPYGFICDTVSVMVYGSPSPPFIAETLSICIAIVGD